MSAEIVRLSSHDRGIVESLRTIPHTPQQLAMKIVDMRLPYQTSIKIAEQVGVSKEHIDRARGIMRHGSPELIEKVRTNQMTLNAATVQVFPNRNRSRVRDNKRKREKRAAARQQTGETVVQLTPALPTTGALTAEAYQKIISACTAIVDLPRDEDVAQLLTTRADRSLLRRALHRLGGINAVIDF